MQDFSKIGLHKVRQSPISDDNVKQTEDTKLKKTFKKGFERRSYGELPESHRDPGDDDRSCRMTSL